MTTHAKYPAIRAGLLERVGKLSPHTALPNEVELAQHYRVSRMTLRRALKELEDEGLIYAVRGHGTFVAERRISKELDLTSFSEDMRGRGLEPGSRILTARVVQASETNARDLALEVGSAVYELVRVRLADSVPMCLETGYLPERFFPGLLEHDLGASLHEILRTVYRTQIVRADQTIAAATLTGNQADLLAARRGGAALQVRRITSDQRGRLIECSTSLYRGDRYSFRLNVRRNGRKLA